MRRWNGWGDDAIEFALNEDALGFLRERVGAGTPVTDATFMHAAAHIVKGRLEPHPLIDTSPATRLTNALGQSLPDWLKLRYGKVGNVPDGVAYPESAEQVRELLAFAARTDAIVI